MTHGRPSSSLLCLAMAGFLSLASSKAQAAPGVQELIYCDCAAATNGDGSAGRPFNNLAHAFAALDGGAANAWDYLYIRGECAPCAGLPGGDCSASYQSPTLEFPSGSSYIYITTWPGAPIAYINGGPSPTGTVMGSRAWNIHHLTIDGLEINGHMSLGGIRAFTLQNSLIHGGGHLDPNLATPADSELIICEDMQEMLIRNNRFYDNDGENTLRATMFTYFGRFGGDVDLGVVFEYNEFFQTASAPKQTNGLFLKSNPEGVTVRYNYFHDLDRYGLFSANQDGPGHNVVVHNNIFERCGGVDTDHSAIGLLHEITGFQFYNNTFIENPNGDFYNLWANTSYHFFNNLSVNSRRFLQHSNGTYPASLVQVSCAELDYNLYYGGGTFRNGPDERGSLADWRTYLAALGLSTYETHSQSLDPMLRNLSEHDTADDFRLTDASPTFAKSGGKGGAAPTYVGAWPPDSPAWIGYCASGVGACDLPSGPRAGGCGCSTVGVATRENLPAYALLLVLGAIVRRRGVRTPRAR